MELVDHIRESVVANSGGLKMTKLVVELAGLNNGSFFNLDEIEKAINESEDLDILEYLMVDGSLRRQKQFVYRKLL